MQATRSESNWVTTESEGLDSGSQPDTGAEEEAPSPIFFAPSTFARGAILNEKEAMNTVTSSTKKEGNHSPIKGIEGEIEREGLSYYLRRRRCQEREEGGSSTRERCRRRCREREEGGSSARKRRQRQCREREEVGSSTGELDIGISVERGRREGLRRGSSVSASVIKRGRRKGLRRGSSASVLREGGGRVFDVGAQHRHSPLPCVGGTLSQTAFGTRCRRLVVSPAEPQLPRRLDQPPPTSLNARTTALSSLHHLLHDELSPITAAPLSSDRASPTAAAESSPFLSAAAQAQPLPYLRPVHFDFIHRSSPEPSIPAAHTSARRRVLRRRLHPVDLLSLLPLNRSVPHRLHSISRPAAPSARPSIASSPPQSVPAPLR
ncbi:uncharacterized protein A4U43_C05F29520 [Asparagus officinalis]|uniref:Uncharacterized protein n=1 Tax=Asparagus officinalis TaxID=4686 RepID=A0A5P1EZP3_ASPOF|nr:uncharacterized protein A4U43_C05F29520 [Asparagus officinalis]